MIANTMITGTKYRDSLNLGRVTISRIEDVYKRQPVLDVEVTGRKEKKELQRGIKRWLDRVESHYGVKPILYTSYKFKTRYLDDSIFNTYPYWIARCV